MRRRADERDVEEFEQALNGAILAVLAVQGAVAHVGTLAAQRGNEVARGIERHHLVADLFKRRAHVFAAGQGELALKRGAAHQHCNFEAHVVSFQQQPNRQS